MSLSSVKGHQRKASSHTYVPPSATAILHNSMAIFWRPLEWFPKVASLREWSSLRTVLGLYIPNAESRPIPNGALVHHSVKERMTSQVKYQPVNFPDDHQVEQDI